jgi:hypothetical protein
VFDTLAKERAAALTHADRLSAHNLETGSDNRGAAVHALVTYLKVSNPRSRRE